MYLYIPGVYVSIGRCEIAFRRVRQKHETHGEGCFRLLKFVLVFNASKIVALSLVDKVVLLRTYSVKSLRNGVYKKKEGKP